VDIDLARADEPGQIVQVAGEQLITREREQRHHRVDDIRAPRTAKQTTRILGIPEA